MEQEIPVDSASRNQHMKVGSIARPSLEGTISEDVARRAQTTGWIDNSVHRSIITRGPQNGVTTNRAFLEQVLITGNRECPITGMRSGSKMACANEIAVLVEVLATRF